MIFLRNFSLHFPWIFAGIVAVSGLARKRTEVTLTRFSQRLTLVLQVHVKFDDFGVLLRRAELKFIHCPTHLFQLLMQDGSRLLKVPNLLLLCQWYGRLVSKMRYLLLYLFMDQRTGCAALCDSVLGQDVVQNFKNLALNRGFTHISTRCRLNSGWRWLS